jgi:CheY-like chemotaxis protein
MSRPIRVLVVDDNQVILRLIALVLEESGLVPVPAESGEIALALARADPPDVMVVDQEMPGMKGAELLRALRWSGVPALSAIPAIGVSAYPQAEQDLRAAGAIAFLRKPIEEEPFLEAVLAALARRRDGARDPVPRSA